MTDPRPMTIEDGGESGKAPGARPSAWRITLRWLELWGWIALLLVATIPMSLALGLRGEIRIDEPRLIPIMVWGVAAALFATRRVARRDALSWGDVGLRREGALRDALAGLAIGLANFALVIAAAALLGWVTIAPTARAAAAALSLAPTAALLLLASAFEEITNRGLLVPLLATRGATTTVLVTAAVFAASHLPNPGIDAVAILDVFVAGAVLCVARLRSGALWLPIGWHLGWNLSQGGIFGCAVSGLGPAAAPLLETRFQGPSLLVGGAFGPESGLLAVAADGATLALYVLLTRPRRHATTR